MRRLAPIAALLALTACSSADESESAACGLPPASSGTPGVTGWSDHTRRVGLPLARVQSASAGDVDGNGSPDYLLASDPYSLAADGVTGVIGTIAAPELYLSQACGAVRALGLVDSIDGDALLEHVVSTAMSDVDSDGRVDLVLGGQNAIQVLYQNAGEPLRFTAVTTALAGRTYGDGAFPDASGEVAVVAVFDLDRDGHKDIYASQVARDGRLTTLDQAVDPPTVQDAILLGDGARGWGIPEAPDPRLVACAAGQTFGVAYITRWHAGLPPLLYTGRDFGFDCLFEIEPGGVIGRKLDIPESDAGADAEPWFSTMGVDHAIDGDTGEVLIAVSDWGAVPLLKVRLDGVVENLSDRLDYGTRVRVGWGLRFTDADLDGVVDLIVAYGNGIRAPTGQVEQASSGLLAERFLLNSLRYYRGERSAGDTIRFNDASVEAGTWFTPGGSGTDDLEIVLAGVQVASDVDAMRRDWYSVVDLDFDRDGCVDLLTAPMLQFQIDHDDGTVSDYAYTSNSNVTLLRNDCNQGHHWLGLIMPDEPGAIAALTTESNGQLTRRFVQVPAAPGIAATGERHLLRFGFGPTVPSLSALTVYWNDGTSSEVDTGPFSLDQYHPIKR